jgi:DNA-directed RNA polymerase subunit beta
MPVNRFFLSDFVAIQRNSFLNFLEKGLIEEFSKRNPITNASNTLEIFFYPEYYQLTMPKYNTRESIIKNKSYASRLYMPVQLTDKQARIIKFKWVYLGDLPIMTKRGHFIINGAARVIVNQIIRSPGIYYQTKIYENFTSQWEQKAESFYERHYADLICQRGTWLRLEIDRDKKIWAQTKRGPKIPIMWLLIALGLNEKMIFKSVLDPQRLIYNMLADKDSAEQAAATNSNTIEKSSLKKPGPKSKLPEYIKTPPEAWAKLYTLFNKQKKTGNAKQNASAEQKQKETKNTNKKNIAESQKNISNVNAAKQSSGPQTWETNDTGLTNDQSTNRVKNSDHLANQQSLSDLGRILIFNKFMNPRTYDLSKQGRLNFNKKLKLTVSPYQTTLTPQDLLAATDYLLKVEYGLKKVDDIDHLKNRRVRTSGELIQIQLGTGLVRLEKSIKEKMELLNTKKVTNFKTVNPQGILPAGKNQKTVLKSKNLNNVIAHKPATAANISINSLINTKPINSALREFFGTSPLSQFMDQINPLAELTHKRRLSSMGPGGVTRDSATLDIRGIHPSHYGRICPVETPEGKNTGLVNSLTTYARVNAHGFIETPFYRVYKGQVQKKLGMYYFSAEQEDKITLGASDLAISDIGFLATSNITVRKEDEFSKISRDDVEYVGVSPLQMVSIATSLIPFLEHDDANRALMGSNMQRQAVPIMKPERPIVGTGLEARAVSDSGHALQSKTSGLITYVSASKLVIYNF